MKTKTHKLTPEAKERLRVFIHGASDESVSSKRALYQKWCEMLDEAIPAYGSGSCVATVGIRGKIFGSEDYEQI